MALSFLYQSQVFQELRSDSSMLLFGEVRFFSKHFGKLYFLALVKKI